MQIQYATFYRWCCICEPHMTVFSSESPQWLTYVCTVLWRCDYKNNHWNAKNALKLKVNYNWKTEAKNDEN